LQHKSGDHASPKRFAGGKMDPGLSRDDEDMGSVLQQRTKYNPEDTVNPADYFHCAERHIFRRILIN
jgi:hypothetical protein